MQIVELGDCSMVIMKDSNDPPWVSVGDAYRQAVKRNKPIAVCKHGETNFKRSSESIYTAGRLVLFFNDDISKLFKLHDVVDVFATI